MMITPPKHSYNLNLGCFAAVTSPLFTSIDRTMTAIADSAPVSHCTRPSSVPSAAGICHRDAMGFLSTRNTSPLREDPLHSPTLDYDEDPLATYSLATPPASCGQQTLSTLNNGSGMRQCLDTSVLQSRPLRSSPPISNMMAVSSSSSPLPLSSLSSATPTSPLIVNCATTSIASSMSGDLQSSVSGSMTGAQESDSQQQPSVNSDAVCSTPLVVHYPELVPHPDGGSRFQPRPDIIMPNRTSDSGKRGDPFYNRLIDVLITLVDSTDRVLYHRCHFSGPLNWLSKFVQSEGTCWRDHVNAQDSRSWEDHFADVLNQATRWYGSNSPSADTQAQLGKDTSDPTHCRRPSRSLVDGPVYRAFVGERWFLVHTFSLPVRPTGPSDPAESIYGPSASVRLNAIEGQFREPLIVHYHSVLGECETDKDVITENSSIGLRQVQNNATKVVWSTASPVLIGSTVSHVGSPTSSIQPRHSGGLPLTTTTCSNLGIHTFLDSPAAMDVLSSSSASTCVTATRRPVTGNESELARLSSGLPSTSSTTPQPFRPSPVLASDPTIGSPSIADCSPAASQNSSLSQSVPMQWEPSITATPSSLSSRMGQEQYTVAVRQPQSQPQQPHHLHHHHHHMHHHLHPANGPNETLHHHHYHHHHAEQHYQQIAVPLAHPHHHHHHHHQDPPDVSHLDRATITSTTSLFTTELANGLPSLNPSTTRPFKINSDKPKVHTESLLAAGPTSSKLNTGSQGSRNASQTVASVPGMTASVTAGAPPHTTVVHDSSPRSASRTDKVHVVGSGRCREQSSNGHADQTHLGIAPSQGRSVGSGKDQYGERIMRLQNLLPPEAIQRIRQIWQEIYGSNKSTSRNASASLTSTATSPSNPTVTTAVSVLPTPPSNATLREHFARRVRQVVRQYLGPNALVNLNRSSASHGSISGGTRVSESRVAAKPTQTFPVPVSTGCVSTTQLSQVVSPQGTPSTARITVGLPITAVEQTRAIQLNPANLAPPITITCTTTSIATVSQALITGSHTTMHGSPVVVSEPIKTQESNKVSSIILMNSSCVLTANTTTTAAGGSSLTVTSSSGMGPICTTVSMPATQLAPTLDLQPPASRRASSTSQCCVLEWLLSDEADLCLLPPSFYEAKNSTAPEGTGFADRTLRGPNAGALTIQLPTTATGTGAILVSPVTPIATTPVRATVEHTVNEVPFPLESGAELPVLMGTCAPPSACTSSSSSGTSPIISSSPVHHRAGSLLVRLLHPTNPSTIGTNADSRVSQTIGSEPTSPDISLVRMDPVPRRPSDNSLGSQVSTYQSPMLSGARSHEALSTNSSASISLCQPSPVNSTVLNSSDPNGSSASSNRTKRRRSGPPTPLLSYRAGGGGTPSLQTTTSVSAITTTTSSTRTRHVSHVDDTHPRITNSHDRSESFASPPFTSLTQLLLQDFTTTTTTTNSTASTPQDTQLPHVGNGPIAGFGDLSDGEGNSISSASLFSISPKQRVPESTSSQIEFGRSAGATMVLAESYPSHTWSAEPTTTKLLSTPSTASLGHPNHTIDVMSNCLIPNATTKRPTMATISPHVSEPGLVDRIAPGYPALVPRSSTDTGPISPSAKPVLCTSGQAHSITLISGAQSSLCRLLLDPQLGPPEPGVTSVRSPHTPLSSTPLSPSPVPGERTRRFSSSSGNKSRTKPTSIDVYEFTTSISNLSDIPTTTPLESPNGSRSGVSSAGSLSSTNRLPFVRGQTDQAFTLSHDAQDTDPSRPSKREELDPEEVEFLYEILRRDELERSQDRNGCANTGTEFDSCSPRAKRSRLGTPCVNSEHSSEELLVGESCDANWQADDAQAVARICEQLQEGFTSTKSAEEMIPLAPESSLIEPSLNIDLQSKNNQERVSDVINIDVPMPTASTVDARYSAPGDYEIGCVIHHLSSSPSSGGLPGTAAHSSSSMRGPLNEAAVAAARASQQAAASQRSKAANQRTLVEQRKRLIQHQLYNQFTVYSATPNCPQPVNNELLITDGSMLSTGNTTITQSTSEVSPSSGSAHQVSKISPTTVRIQPRTRHASSSVLHTHPNGAMQMNPNLSVSPSVIMHGLQLTATTVVSLSTSPGPAVSSRSTLSTFYQHRPEDLPRYLKEVGPNVRVQLSAPPPPAIVVSSTRLPLITARLDSGKPSHFVPDPYSFVQPGLTSVTPPPTSLSLSSIPATSCVNSAVSLGQISPGLGDVSNRASPCSLLTQGRGGKGTAGAAVRSSVPCTGSLGITLNTVAQTGLPSGNNDANGSLAVTPVLTDNRLDASNAQRRPKKSGNSNRTARRSNSGRPTGTTHNACVTSLSSAVLTPTDTLRSPPATEVSARFVSLDVAYKPSNTNSVSESTYIMGETPHWTSVSCVPTPASTGPTSVGDSYILGYAPNALNVITTTLAVTGGAERQPYVFTTQPALTSSNVLLVHSETHPSMAVVCDPTSAATLSHLSPSSNPKLPLQSTAFVYSLPSSEHTAASHTTVLPIQESTVVPQVTATAQLHIVPSSQVSSSAFVEKIAPGSVSPVVSRSQDASVPIHPRTSSVSSESRIDLVSESNVNGSTAPDLLLISNSDPLDAMKPEENLLPDDIINDVFGLETMVAAKQHQNRQDSAMFTEATDQALCFARCSPTADRESEVMMDLHGLPSTASSSPSPCSPQLSNTLLPDMRSSCLSP